MKTTITVDAEDWQAFQHSVLANEGKARKLNAVMIALIKGYTSGEFKVRA